MHAKPIFLRHLWLTLLLIGWLLWIPPIQAQYEEPTDPGYDLATGAACFLITPVYGAFKLAFAGLGALTGGLTWIFTGGDTETAQRIWNTSMGGTYIITPDHLAGRKPIRFAGDP